jgi:hypothetical protein
LALAVQVVRLEQQLTNRLQWVLLAVHLHLVTTLVLLGVVVAVFNQVAPPVAAAPVVEVVAQRGSERLLIQTTEPLAVYLLAGILVQMALLPYVLLTTLVAEEREF